MGGETRQATFSWKKVSYASCPRANLSQPFISCSVAIIMTSVFSFSVHSEIWRSLTCLELRRVRYRRAGCSPDDVVRVRMVWLNAGMNKLWAFGRGKSNNAIQHNSLWVGLNLWRTVNVSVFVLCGMPTRPALNYRWCWYFVSRKFCDYGRNMILINDERGRKFHFLNRN